jgi:hypothetical protein
LFLATVGATGQAAAQTPLFSEDSELQIVLEGPLAALVRSAPRSTDPVQAAVSYVGESGSQRFDIELSPRGISRRTGGICSFPPLRLDFDRGELRGTLWQGQNRLKLVTRCRPGSRYEQLPVLEYMAYRLFNEITPQSFRVRPVRVTYRDTGGRRREDTQFNFLIEDVDDVARRNRLVALEVMSNEVRSTQLDPVAASRVGLFQYMIGNLDWDMVAGPAGEECCHNGKLMASSEASRSAVVPLPYDFDHSGFVGAPYALPPEGLGVRNVRTRLYRGLCIHNNELPATITHFRARREALYAVIDGETRLSDARRQAARRYIEDFFAVLDDPDRVRRQLIERCRS